MKDWDAVAAYALSLPESEVSTSYGQAAIKVRGKMFVSTGREDGSFHVRSPHEEKALLIETDPATFWQTPHYANWPGLLVRYGSADAERVKVVIARAWWDQAPMRLRKGHGDRPDRFTRFAAIDWSGARGSSHKGIALAVCETGDAAPILVAPPGRAWSRTAIHDWLLAQADTALLVGLDLSPAFAFLDEGTYFPGLADSPADARALWAMVDTLAHGDADFAADGVLADTQIRRHFRQQRDCGDLFPGGAGRMRVCEFGQRAMGLSPTSCFNLVGASQVGKASLTGMRVLHSLRGRLPVWPFDPVPTGGAVIVEIYTTIAARAAGIRKGLSKMRDAASLDSALVALGSKPHAALARYDDHATDAILTAAWLRANAMRRDLWAPEGLTPHIARTEGWTFGVASAMKPRVPA